MYVMSWRRSDVTAHRSVTTPHFGSSVCLKIIRHITTTNRSLYNRYTWLKKSSEMAAPTEILKVFTSLTGFYLVLGNWIGYDHTPSSEYLYSWTAFWISCCCVCTHFSYPWPFVGGTVAWTGVMKNVGMLWRSYPHRGTQPGIEVWLPWIAGLTITVLAASSTFYRTTSARWTKDTASKPISLNDEAV